MPESPQDWRPPRITECPHSYEARSVGLPACCDGTTSESLRGSQCHHDAPAQCTQRSREWCWRAPLSAGAPHESHRHGEQMNRPVPSLQMRKPRLGFQAMCPDSHSYPVTRARFELRSPGLESRPFAPALRLHHQRISGAFVCFCLFSQLYVSLFLVISLGKFPNYRLFSTHFLLQRLQLPLSFLFQNIFLQHFMVKS